MKRKSEDASIESRKKRTRTGMDAFAVDATGNDSRLANKVYIFEERCGQLLVVFKKKFGHCNVPQRYSTDPTFGGFCKAMRHTCTYSNATRKNIGSMVFVKRKIGFKWNFQDLHKIFEQRAVS